MIGYPNGLMDRVHNLPIVRRGTTATHPSIPFNGLRQGLVDIETVGGSSGSPIFIRNDGFTYENGMIKIQTGPPFNFLGIVTGLHDSPSSIKKSENGTKSEIKVVHPMHLGVYIHAAVMYEFALLMMIQFSKTAVAAPKMNPSGNV